VGEKQREANDQKRGQAYQKRLPVEGVVTIAIEHQKSLSKSENQ
jgi:hypothetical protein